MTIQGDHPLYKMALWSIRSVLAVEPYVELSIEPGETHSAGNIDYEYYTLSPPQQAVAQGQVVGDK
jgi:hypothetical protein